MGPGGFWSGTCETTCGALPRRRGQPTQRVELVMPTYEYECNACRHRFERFQSITAEPVKECPECGGEVRRLIGAGAGLIFRGSGFYITDYRSSDYKRAASSESGKGSSGNGSGDSTKKGSSSKPKEGSPFAKKE